MIRPYHFWIPAVILFFGIFQFTHNEKPYNILWLVGFGILAALVVLWYFVFTEWNEKTRLEDSKADKYKQWRLLSAEDKEALMMMEGLQGAPERLKIERITRTSEGGSIDQVRYDWLPVAPAKFKIFCQRVLQGEALTYENFGGAEKLFSRPGFEKLLKKLDELNYIQYSDGYNTTPEPTDEGKTVFYEYLNPEELQHA